MEFSRYSRTSAKNDGNFVLLKKATQIDSMLDEILKEIVL